MRTLSLSNVIAGEQSEVFQYVTVFPVQGEPDSSALEQKYGQFLGHENNTYTFLENIGGGITWECVFDPPAQRVMRAVDSTWSDRTDRFESVEGGTLWTITWQLKAQGMKVFTQWITFHLRAKRQVYGQAILPVLMHFQTTES